MNKKLLITFVIVGTVAAGFWFFWQSQQKVAQKSRAEIPAEQQALGGVLYENVGDQSNPFKQAPDVAPLPAGTNPFKDAYRNPFAK